MNLLTWPLALGALALGLIIGTAMVFGSARGKSGSAQDTARADLIARRDALYDQLRELDDTRDKLDGDLYAAERARLLAAAADVLRALDKVAPPAARPDPAAGEGDHAAKTGTKPESWSTRHPRLSSALWGLGAAAAVLLLREALDSNAAARVEGQSITGAGGGGGMGGGQADAGPAAPALPPEMQAALDELKAKAAVEPPDLEAKNRYGHALIAADQVMVAWKEAEAVVALDADNAEARVHQAVVLLQIGDQVMAAKLLDRVLSTSPNQAEALGYRGALYAESGQRQEAIDAWTKAKEADPDQAPMFNQLIAGVDGLIARAEAQRASGSADAPPGGAGEPAPPVAPAGDAEFTGEVRLASGLTGSGTLFIYVRAEGVTSGPPLRVKKLPAQFPVKFAISASDSPMGGTLPTGKVQLSARLDGDGNVMTKDPADPVAISAPVAAGATDLVLELAPAP
ncbi:hypothetical protein LBMAG42_29270 [Deltaproteobacteria bacterium]|nr:hypothetical protein LBMAG42_29270 [Deltaproteobacteria bacterium]